MRCILGLCVVLAAIHAAWITETKSVAGELEYQAPAATVTSPMPQVTGTPAVPAMSPAGVYPTMTAQPTMPAMTPAPTMTSPTTYPVGTQPVTTYAMPMPGTTYTTNSYPMMMGNGRFRMFSPTYSYTPMPATTTYGTPAPTYSGMPAQTYYPPVQRRFGLFQRWRQQAMPAYNTTPVYGAPTYSTSVYPTATYGQPMYTTYSYATPAYYTTMPTTLPAAGMTSAGTMAPVYTPTMLNVPTGTPAPATAAPTEPTLRDTKPAQAIPSATGTTPDTDSGATTSVTPPPPPPIRTGPK